MLNISDLYLFQLKMKLCGRNDRNNLSNAIKSFFPSSIDSRVNLAKSLENSVLLSFFCSTYYSIEIHRFVACHTEICFCFSPTFIFGSSTNFSFHKIVELCSETKPTHLRVLSSFCPFVVQTQHMCYCTDVMKLYYLPLAPQSQSFLLLFNPNTMILLNWYTGSRDIFGGRKL